MDGKIAQTIDNQGMIWYNRLNEKFGGTRNAEN
jgi:hypothetical protein